MPKDLREIPTGSPTTGAPNSGWVGYSWHVFDQYLNKKLSYRRGIVQRAILVS